LFPRKKAPPQPATKTSDSFETFFCRDNSELKGDMEEATCKQNKHHQNRDHKEMHMFFFIPFTWANFIRNPTSRRGFSPQMMVCRSGILPKSPKHSGIGITPQFAADWFLGSAEPLSV